MNRTVKILMAVILVVVVGLVGRHFCTKELLTFVSVRVTEFGIRRSGTSLNFPLTIGVLDSAQAVRDVEEAEYFYSKLSSIYDFKMFSYYSSTTLDTVLKGTKLAEGPVKVFSAEGSEGELRLALESYSGSEASFRLSRFGSDTLNYPFTATSGRSVSVGLTHKADSTSGKLLIVTAWLHQAQAPFEEGPILQFLAEKNRVRSSKEPSAPIYLESDQRLLDTYLGVGAIKLPIADGGVGPVQYGKRYIHPDSLDEHPFAQENLPNLFGKLIYPESAREDKVTGTVLLNFMVDSTGVVQEVRVLRRVRPDLDSAACSIFESVVFHPPKYKGVGVSTWLTLPIRFTLR